MPDSWHCLNLFRFEATRQIRCLENEINEQIACGEASADMFGNVGQWRVPILAMTADVIQASNEQCMKCGMDDYVSKPFEDEQLYTAVARFFMSGWYGLYMAVVIGWWFPLWLVFIIFGLTPTNGKHHRSVVLYWPIPILTLMPFDIW